MIDPAATDETTRVVAVVVCVTSNAATELLLVAKFAAFVATKVAFKDALAVTARDEVVQIACPKFTVTESHPEIETGDVAPVVKFTVPTAVEGETIAVRVTLVPAGTVVIVVLGAEARPTFSVVVVAVAVAWAMPTVDSKKSSRKAALTLPLRTRLEIARNPFRVVASGMGSILSNIFKSSAIK